MSENPGHLQDTISRQVSISDTLSSKFSSRKDTSKSDTVKKEYVVADSAIKQQSTVLKKIKKDIKTDTLGNHIVRVTKPLQEYIKVKEKKTNIISDQDSLLISPETVNNKNFLQLLTKSDSEKVLKKMPVFVNSTSNSQYKQHSSALLFGRNIIKHPNDFVLGIVLFVIVLIVWIRLAFNKFITGIISALLSYQISFKMFQQRNSVMKRAFFILNSIYVIVLSLFIVEVLRFYKLQIMEFTGLIPFLVLTGIIVLILLVRLILLKLIGYIFDSGNIFAEYIHNVFLANKNLGLFLIPVVVGIAYLPYQLAKISVVIGMVLIITTYLFRLVRGFQIIFRKDVFIFYLILYLCTLEILPLLLGYKFLNALS